MRRRLGLAAILGAAASAAAQDRDPFDAVLEAQRVREKQMVQVRRADTRIVNPLQGDPLPPTRHAPAGTPIDLPRQLGPGEGRAPWLLGVIALGALIGFVAWRRSRRAAWSKLPGHQGLRRDTGPWPATERIFVPREDPSAGHRRK